MLETYVIARDKFLKPDGRMFPTRADLCIQPFTEQAIFDERVNGAEWWNQKKYYGLDISVLHEKAVAEKFEQPILDSLDPKNLLSERPYRKQYNFEKCTVEDLKHVKMEFTHIMQKTALLHGYVMYFDAFFDGSD